MSYLLKDYHYHLPPSRIAQQPADRRSDARLMRLDRDGPNPSHHRFDDLPHLLRLGDLLVINNTRVVPARLFGKKETGGRVEVLITDYSGGIQSMSDTGRFQCRCMVRASRAPRIGSLIHFDNRIHARVVDRDAAGYELCFTHEGDLLEALNAVGRMPLPPYIRRRHNGDDAARDKVRYQTVYAEEKGAVAAPTAGLHFTRELMDQLSSMGIDFARITLHVGHGTFAPVRVKDIRDHRIHSEAYSISENSAALINQARQKGCRIIAVGTTCVRTLEYAAGPDGRVAAGSGVCDLFIYPGYSFKAVDAVITNFHLPESTLIMLVSAFAGRQNILSAYKTAVENEYRFFSYGDAMLLE